MRRAHLAPALGAALSCLLMSPAEPAAAAPRRPAPPLPAPSLSAVFDAYWTPARMRAARPVAGDGKPAAPIAARAGAPGPTANSRPFGGLPMVGTFFWQDATGAGRFCSGSVVSSPGRNLVMSAGHCFDDQRARKRLTFVPKYDDGRKPYGAFAVKPGRVYVDKRYLTKGPNAAADLDFSFLQLEKRAGRNVQDVVGGSELAVNPGYRHPTVRLIGYPAAKKRPLDCTDKTVRYDSRDPKIPGSFLRIHCDGYTNGVSGGPFLVKKGSGWRIIGVIGGWKTGGDKADISYSSYFDKDVKALYDSAVANRPPAHRVRRLIATDG
ncbi:hypothetical protein CD790_16265 [Streptomyces sp. SAJ15]|nr:hypothetical protein CD790_16265 [Streptomyces sp. SAJ15]